MTEESLATKVENQLQMSKGRDALRVSLDPLDQNIDAVLKGAQIKRAI